MFTLFVEHNFVSKTVMKGDQYFTRDKAIISKAAVQKADILSILSASSFAESISLFICARSAGIHVIVTITLSDLVSIQYA